MESEELKRLVDALERQRYTIDRLKSLRSDTPYHKAWRTQTMELVRRLTPLNSLKISRLVSTLGILYHCGASSDQSVSPVSDLGISGT